MNKLPGQINIFGDVPAPHVAGSATSAAAADSITPHTPTLREQILELLRAQGSMTDEEMQDILRMPGSTQRPRRGELAAAGLIVRDGESVTRSGRRAVRWAAVR